MKLVKDLTTERLRRMTRGMVFLGVWCWVTGPALFAAEETFNALSVGKTTYTNVTVLSKTRTDIFLKHAHGMVSVKVKDLDPSTQVRLGYQLELPKQTKMDKVFQGPDTTELEADPRVQEVEERFAQQFGEALERWDPRIVYGVIGSVVGLYLLFSYLCRSICVKTGNPASPLIWLPFLKQIPLFKAAGMSPWWILTNFVPPVFLIAYIMWCFKIVESRGKHAFFGVLLLLPGTNILAFLFLALSGDGRVDRNTNRNVISLQSTQHRDAA